MIEKSYENNDDLKILIQIESLDDIKNLITKSQHNNEYLWYRGVINAQFRLLPKVIRNAQLITDQFGRFADPYKIRFSESGDKYLFPNFIRMLDVFKEVVGNDISSIVKTDFDWLFIAQHYGLPTPLLDWTERLEIALWFATNEVNTYKKTVNIKRNIWRNELSSGFAAIYILDPYELNNNVSDFDNVHGPVDVDQNYDAIKSYLSIEENRPYGPICLKGKAIDVRLKKQKGNFTIHGSNIWSIDYYTVYRKMITKVLIPLDLCKEINNYLETLGINHEYIYSGFDAKEYAARAIEIYENKSFNKYIYDYRVKKK